MTFCTNSAAALISINFRMQLSANFRMQLSALAVLNFY